MNRFVLTCVSMRRVLLAVMLKSVNKAFQALSCRSCAKDTDDSVIKNKNMIIPLLLLPCLALIRCSNFICVFFYNKSKNKYTTINLCTNGRKTTTIRQSNWTDPHEKWRNKGISLLLIDKHRCFDPCSPNPFWAVVRR